MHGVSYRFANGAPSSYSLRGSLGSGFVYQFAARASPLVLLLAAVWFLLTASLADRVMVTEVLANALEVCDCQMIQGCAGQQSESQTSKQAWEFNSNHDNVVGAFFVQYCREWTRWEGGDVPCHFGRRSPESG